MPSTDPESRRAKHNAYKIEWQRRNPEKVKAAQARYRASHKEELRKRYILSNKTDAARANQRRYRLSHKPKMAERMRRYRLEHPEYEATRKSKQQARTQALKTAVYAGYGNQCACCGERTIAFLTVDHVNNDGARERRSGVSLDLIYRRIIESRFPDNYQLLCRNCNWGKHINKGVCPHVSARLRSA